jgi:hypothetical protein
MGRGQGDQSDISETLARPGASTADTTGIARRSCHPIQARHPITGLEQSEVSRSVSGVMVIHFSGAQIAMSAGVDAPWRYDGWAAPV